MVEKLYYTAADVADMLGVGRTSSYAIVKQLNKELTEQGYITTKGKIPRDYFDARYYGGSHRKEVTV
jgi:prophage antirepressor-like protein